MGIPKLGISTRLNARQHCRWALVPAAALVWAAGISGGMFALWGYAHAPGDQESSPRQWPTASRLVAPTSKPVLLLFAHPRCPCTRATFNEFERLVAEHHLELESRVVFIKAPQLDQQWLGTDLRRQAAAIRGIQLFWDRDGTESERFQARTSGLALLYSAQGKLLFQGGLTASRGHEGSSAGIAALQAILSGDQAGGKQTPVYGCPLQIHPQLTMEDTKS